MKKLLWIFCCCAFVANGAFAADCTPQDKVEGRYLQDKLYSSIPDANDDRNALICDSDYCTGGTYIYVDDYAHAATSDGKKIEYEDPAIHKCLTGGDDVWVVVGAASLPNCTGDVSGYDIIRFDETAERRIYGNQIEPGLSFYTDLCSKPYATICGGAKCSSNMKGRDGLCLTDGKRYRCKDDGEWDVVTKFYSVAPENPGNMDDKKIKNGADGWKKMSVQPSSWAYIKCDHLEFFLHEPGQKGGNLYTADDYWHQCENGYYSTGYDADTPGCCVDNKEEALCKWIEDDVADWVDGECKCFERDGKQYEWNRNTFECDEVVQQQKTWEEQCREKHPNASAERLACCLAGRHTTWNGTETSGQCRCTDENTTWKYKTGDLKGKCEQKAPVVNNDDEEEQRRRAEEEERSRRQAEERRKAEQRKQEKIKKYKLIKANLSDFFATAKASGWRTADGKFNTVRLVSDIGAGVVLGTVGGVVSGVVIKKKQIEKGFEALKCSVGGQNVATWGDTFIVGMSGQQ